ncbi:MAG TPA: hypothetical protein VMC79_02940 [Rectinemataceae bacterium]|nr:hypothetical protein [Rectinemataceae bacterium]
MAEGPTIAGEGAHLRLQCVGMALLAVACLYFLTGCGIETITYFYPPLAGSAIQSSTSLTLSHNTSNNSSDFLGYDLYYRCYADLTKAEADRVAIESLAASSSSSPDAVLYAMVNTWKFTRMYNSTGAGSTPLLSFPSTPYKSSPATFIISLSSSSEWTVSSTYSGSPVINSGLTLYRSATISSGSHKYFTAPPPSPSGLADFDALTLPSDPDYDGYTYTGGVASGYPADNYYSTPTSLFIVVFAIGLGLPTDNINMVPSIPASFGATIQIR